MDIGSSVAVSATSGQAGLQYAVSIAVLRKALDFQAQNAQQLLQMLPPPAPANNPPHLGQAVDVLA
jgi:hypothetical protein